MAAGTHQVFILKNMQSGNHLSLQDGYRDTENWAVPSNEADNIDYFKQLWLLVDTKQKDSNGNPIYKIRCLQSGTDLNMSAQQSGLAGEQTVHYVSGQRTHDMNNQRWTFKGAGGSQWYIRNVDNGKYLDLIQSQASGFYVVCKDEQNATSQIWNFERRSRGCEEISDLLKKDTKIQDNFANYQADGAYMNLPKKIIDEIWNAGLVGLKYKWRSEIFDCDDFAVNMKAEVAKWSYDKIKCDDVSILMGIYWGRHPKEGAHAFNWYLSPDLNSIIMYEPQTGKEGGREGAWLKDYVGWYAAF